MRYFIVGLGPNYMRLGTHENREWRNCIITIQYEGNNLFAAYILKPFQLGTDERGEMLNETTGLESLLTLMNVSPLMRGRIRSHFGLSTKGNENGAR